MATRARFGRLFGGLCLLAVTAGGCKNGEQSAAPPTDQTSREIKGRETVWLVLKAQADLSRAKNIKDWKERGQFVYDQLNSMVATQTSLRSKLQSRGISFKPFWIVNTIRVEADPATIAELAKDPAVAKVLPDETFSIPPVTKGTTEPRVQNLEWGLTNVRAPEAWSTFSARGEGIVVANIDTGVQFDHPALVRQYRGNQGNGTFDHNYNWNDPANICGTAGIPCDNNSHGTHTMGTMVGDDGDPGVNQIGVAPHAKWIAAKGCEFNSCSTASLLAAGQWVLAPTNLAGQMPRPDLRPHIVNNSWGGGGGQTWYQATVQAWVAAGIFPSFSNGNSGPSCSTAGSPGDNPEAYGVGAYDISNAIASFSSRGASLLGGILKPNIAAPGVNVRSAVPGSSYGSLSGTSMAAPHLSGVVALVWSAAPTLVGDIAATRTLLDDTARDTADLSCGGTADFNNVFGEGRVDAYAAVDLAPRGPIGEAKGVVSAAGGAPLAGATVRAEGPSNRTTTTGSDGSYSMMLPVGTYTLVGTAYGYNSATVTGVEITENGTTTTNLELAPVPSFAVSGTVRDADGTPVAGATITILGTPIPPAMSGADGTYSFAAVPVGQYEARAEADGRCRSPQMLPLVVDSAETVDFTLPRRIDAFGYSCASVPFAYIDANTVIPLSGDDSVVPVTLPFPFRFYGADYTTVNVTTNGNIHFGPATASYSNTSLPNLSFPNAAVYALWDDLYVDSGLSSVRSEVVGTAPNRRFVIEWRDVRFYSGGVGRMRFQIVLTEDNKVIVQYHTTGSDGQSQGNSATAGVENADGTVALQYSYGEAALFSGTAIRYARELPNDPTPPTVAVTAPMEGATVGGSVTVSATAADNLAVASVQFYVDRGTPNEQFLGTDATAPYQVVWNAVNTPNGPHVLTARAIDVADNATVSAPVMVTVFNDLTAPTVQITAPMDGSTVTGMTNIAVSAMDNVAVTQVQFFVDGTIIGSDTTAPFELVWNTTGASGSRMLTARAFDAAGNSAVSPMVRVTVLNPEGASYDPMLRAPRCTALGAACDSQGLLNGRAGLGPEPNQPNTVDSCADGTSGAYHSDESLDRLRIETVDGTPLAPGKQVRVTATVWAYNATSNSLDVYHSPSVPNPVWTRLGTLQTTGSGLRTITGTFFLPTGGNASQVIRGNWRYGGSAAACSSGNYDDRDDLIFAVPPPADATPPTAAITSPPSGGTVRGSLAVAATATDNVSVSSVALLVDGTVVATDTTAPYQFQWDTTTVGDGLHQLVARATDAAGNIGNSAAVSVTTDNTAPSVAITAPANGSTVTGTVNVSASATDANAIAQVRFFLDGAPQSTATLAPYVWSWNTAGVAPGDHILTATATDSVGNVATSATVTVIVAQPSFVYLWPEAESGNLTSPLQNLTDVNASGGRYIQVAAGNNSNAAPPATGRATYTFNVPSAGTYKVWGRVIAPTTGDDSFWAIMDNGTPVNWNGIALGAAWHWDEVHNGAVTGNPIMQFNLSAGNHTLVIAYREDGTRLDRLLITNDSAFVPTGTGPVEPPLPPGGVMASAGDGQITVSWNASAGAATYNVMRGSSGGPYDPLVGGLTGTSHLDPNLANGTEYCYVVTATNSAGTSAASTQACATPAVPSWLSQDVGAVGTPGSWVPSGGTHTVRGSGADIWGTLDEFRYVYQNVTGDVTIVARVASVENINVWTKAGIMIRDGLAPNARNVMALVSATAANMYRVQSRSVAGEGTTSMGAGGGTAPVWLRLVRAGNTFTASHSPNGTTWSPLGAPITIALPPNTTVGMAVTSHQDPTLATGVFDSVTITQP